MYLPVQGMLRREEAEEAVLPVLHLIRQSHTVCREKAIHQKQFAVASLEFDQMKRTRPSYGTGGTGVPH